MKEDVIRSARKSGAPHRGCLEETKAHEAGEGK